MSIKDLLDKGQQLKSQVLYKHLKVDQARDYLMRLSDRERQIVTIASIALGIFILLGAYSIIAASLNSMESNINKEIKSFNKVLDMRNEYLSYFAVLKKIENTIQKTPAGFSLATHLENLASENGIKIESMKAMFL